MLSMRNYAKALRYIDTLQWLVTMLNMRNGARALRYIDILQWLVTKRA